MRNRNRRRKRNDYSFLRFLLQATAIGLLAWLITTFTPWWGIAIAAFLVSFFIGKGGFRSFLEGFFGVGMCWLLAALVVNVQTNALLSERIGQLFMGVSPSILMVVTMVVGGLVGGFSAMNGFYLRRIFE